MPRFSWTSERVREALGLSDAGFTPRTYSGVSTDSRTLEAGALFVALRGDRFDGTDFVGAAVERGALGAVVERRPTEVPEDFELFEVSDALAALGQLASARRRALDPTVVGITGTSGKTTTRQLTAVALGPGAYASPGNFNNLVGVPLSILAAPEEANIWVLELASNQPGEIAHLTRMAEPDYAVVTSVSEGHLEGLRSFQGVLDEKLSLVAGLAPGGRALVADEPEELLLQARAHGFDVRTVGLNDWADERPRYWSTSPDGVVWTWKEVEFELPGFGTHLIQDGMFAACVAEMLGVDIEAIAERLRQAELPPMRGEVRRIGELLLLVDCYNANPSSFVAAIDALNALAAGRRRAVLAGTMLELGERSGPLHEKVAEAMLAAGIELVAVVGKFAEAFQQASARDKEALIVGEDLESAYRQLSHRLQGTEAVLLKASRGMKFERAIPWFENDFGTR